MFSQLGQQPGTTGRYIVLLREEGIEQGIKTLEKSAGVQVKDLSERSLAGELETAEPPEGAFSRIGVVVTSMDPDQLRGLGVASLESTSAILAVEPERVVYALGSAVAPATPGEPLERALSSGLSVEYVTGYRDSVDHLLSVLESSRRPQRPSVARRGPGIADESQFTWGLQVTGVAQSRLTGKGIKVAVLDTGFGPHPDFVAGRVVAKSFVPGETAQDGHGHGTHCIGTAAGPRDPQTRPRYGIAYEADVFAGKVLSNAGSGRDGWILAGIDWAISSGCHIISMSLGAPTLAGQPFSRVFDGVAQRALRRGTLIVAAAGNESHRPELMNPVGHPANCPSIMAVAAVDPQLQVAWFSNRAINPNGGEVDIAAPGMRVISSWPLPPYYRPLNGTSMATPHVAGIAALHAQGKGVRAQALWQSLVAAARKLPLPDADVGAGLAQAI